MVIVETTDARHIALLDVHGGRCWRWCNPAMFFSPCMRDKRCLAVKRQATEGTAKHTIRAATILIAAGSGWVARVAARQGRRRAHRVRRAHPWHPGFAFTKHFWLLGADNSPPNVWVFRVQEVCWNANRLA